MKPSATTLPTMGINGPVKEHDDAPARHRFRVIIEHGSPVYRVQTEQEVRATDKDTAAREVMDSFFRFHEGAEVVKVVTL